MISRILNRRKGRDKPPQAFVLSSGGVTHTSVSLSWTESKNSEYYRVYRKLQSETGYFQIANNVTVRSYVDNDASPNTPYHYRIQAVNSLGEINSNQLAVTTSPIPAPTSTVISFSDITSNSIKVNWEARTYATTYKIYRRVTGSGTSWQFTATLGNVLSYVDTGLVHNTSYDYMVRAENGTGGGNSPVATTSTNNLPLPEPPTNIKFSSISYNSLRITWDAALHADTYRVHRRLATGGGWQLITPSQGNLLYNDSGLEPATQYQYMVQSENIVGTANSAYYLVTTNAAPTPGSFTLTLGAFDHDSVALSWEASVNALSYTVYRRLEGATPWTTLQTGITSPRTYTDNTVSAYTAYQYLVKAINEVGELNSNIVDVTTSEIPAPQPPYTLTLGAYTHNSVALSWNAPQYADSYTVYRRLQGTTAWSKVIGGLTTLTYSDTSVSAATAYEYFVRATNNQGVLNSNIVQVLTNNPPEPQEFMLYATSITTTSAQLNWGISAGATSYTLFRRLAGTSSWGIVASGLTNRTHTNNNLSPATNYEYLVRAFNTAGQKDSNIISVTTAGDPPPSAFTLSVGTVKYNSVAISWTASTGASTYNIQRKLSSSSSWGTVATGRTSRTYTDNTVASNTAYNYRIQAINSGGSTYSNIANATTPQVDSSLLPVISSVDAFYVEFATVNYQINATNNPTSYGATGLPSGLSINTSTGKITGTGPSWGDYSVTLSATNSYGTTTKKIALSFTTSFTTAGVNWGGTKAIACAGTNAMQLGKNSDIMGSSTVFFKPDGSGGYVKADAGYYKLIGTGHTVYYFNGNNVVTNVGTC